MIGQCLKVIGLQRLLVVAILVITEAALAGALVTATPQSAAAQMFDDRFPFWGGGYHHQHQYRQQAPQYQSPFAPFQQQQQEAPRPQVDYSKAPPPKPADPQASPPLTSVVVMGDSMADWLAYGLEQAFTDSPDIGVERKHRTWSGLIHNETRADPRGLNPDWPSLARDILNTDKANFVVMMIGLNDRQSIKDRQPPKPAAQPNPPNAPPGPPATAQQGSTPPATPPEAKPPVDDEQSPDPDAPAANAEPQQKGTGTYEFHTDKWAELYSKRIDETITALKSKGATVVWVGLPPLRGTRSSADVAYLNDLYRSRADKAGVTYVDIWDGFVDESGHFAQSGPDFEGQTRRLRAGDGVHFTQAGARKLAHYVQREIERVIASRSSPIAVPVQIEPTPQVTAPRPGGGMARPLAGPVMPLTAALNSAGPDELLGGGAVRQSLADAVASRVLVKGDSVAAPQGRADDFAWPRRDVAPVGVDPVAATTTVPMTPMIPERPVQATASQPAAPEGAETTPRTARNTTPGSKPPGSEKPRVDARRNGSNPFFFLFPGR
jgi:hypothetical protein